MKKAGNFIMIFFLLIATGGLSITRHFCGHSFESFSIFSTPKPCCNNGCDKCHNVFSFNKLTDAFDSSSSDALPSITFNQIQADFYIDLIGSIPAIPVAVMISSRKFLILKTGDFPVSFGNFRC
jgi:hypothetical protein